ncbi:MAG: site-specific integrase [Deltaproteobacteria bacterium]|nr:site-specific integrase [Deltaproteobacteria bacterium]
MAYIFKRAKSRFWWVGYIENSRPVQKSLKVTAKDAARILLSEYQTLEAKETHHSTLLTIKRDLNDAIKEYLERGNIGKAAETVKEKIGALNRFRSYLDGREQRLDYITLRTMEAYYEMRLKKTIAGANKDLKVVKTFFNNAIRKGYLRTNPAAGVKKVKPVKKIFRDMSFKEVYKLLETAKTHYPHLHPIILSAYYLGMRKNELIFLEWDDVDFDKGIVLVRSKPENRVKDCEERIIPLNQKLKDVLIGLPRNGRFVFPTKSGVPWKNNFHRELQKVVMAAGLKHISIQTMRETFGSHLLKKGVSVYLISKYLGHSSVDVTTRHYAHIQIEETHKEIDLL